MSNSNKFIRKLKTLPQCFHQANSAYAQFRELHTSEPLIAYFGMYHLSFIPTELPLTDP